jgi:alkylation response protein AidB-like acyl-CoA dehydrogenase
VTTDGDALLELARSVEHLAELRTSVDDVLTKEWSAERSRELLDVDGPTWALDLWQRLAALGWADLLVDGTVADFCVVAEAVGAATAPVPFVTAAVATWATASGADGGTTVVVPGTMAARASANGEVVLSGEHLLAPYANVAHRLLVSAHGDGGDGGDRADVVVALDADRHGVTRDALRTLDAAPAAIVTLRDVVVPADRVIARGAAAAALAREADLRVTLGWTAELTGVAAAANDAAVEYARQRIAFGRPIGQFQAIKHRLVDQRAAIEVSRALVARAALALDTDATDRAALVALAAFWAGDSLRAVPEGAIQVFGGIGYTWEHVAHVYLRRAAVLTALLGPRATHRDTAAAWLRAR